ncbi:hypothetical protein B0H14DRAFT_2611979 [Mycena olivaceomarginata]|nr:hypothetical protein B0H14DRAFT_2611979 [Mycena olivaceomarginata]
MCLQRNGRRSGGFIVPGDERELAVCCTFYLCDNLRSEGSELQYECRPGVRTMERPVSSRIEEIQSPKARVEPATGGCCWHGVQLLAQCIASWTVVLVRIYTIVILGTSRVTISWVTRLEQSLMGDEGRTSASEIIFEKRHTVGWLKTLYSRGYKHYTQEDRKNIVDNTPTQMHASATLPGQYELREDEARSDKNMGIFVRPGTKEAEEPSPAPSLRTIMPSGGTRAVEIRANRRYDSYEVKGRRETYPLAPIPL